MPRYGLLCDRGPFENAATLEGSGVEVLRRLRDWSASAYIRWSLFLSSYVPLLGIVSLRLWEKNSTLGFGSLVLAGGFAVNLAILLNWRVAPRDFRIEQIESGSNEVAGYIASYLLPFLVVGDMHWRDLLAYAILVWTIGLVMTRGDMLHINPLLSLLRYRIYTVTTVDSVTYYLIATGRVEARSRIRAVPFLDRLLVQR